MGFFDRFKKAQPDPTPSGPVDKPYGPVLMELATLISGGEAAVMEDISACTADAQGWFLAHQEQYLERGVTSAEDLELVQWLALADILEAHNWVCERDWKDELEDFCFFAEQLNGFQAQKLTIDPTCLDEDGDIPAWCAVLTEKWSPQGVCIAAIDIDSDSYVLFPFPAAQLPALQKLAKQIGRHIDFVENM